MPKPPAKDFADLPESLQEEIGDRLRNGQTLQVVAEWLIATKPNLYSGLTLGWMIKKVHRYRRAVVIPQQQKELFEKMGNAGGPVSPKRMQQLSTLEELYEMLEIQKVRTQKILITESANPAFLLDVASAQSRDYQKLCMELTKLEMELGLRARVPRSMQGVAKVNPDGSVDFSVTEGQALYDRVKDEMEALASGKEYDGGDEALDAEFVLGG